MNTTNASNIALVSTLADARVGTFSGLVVRKKGKVVGGASGVRYGDDLVHVTLVTGFKYGSLVQRSADALDDMTDANREESEAVAAGDGVAVASASARKRDAARVARGVMAGVVTNGAQALLALALLEKVSMSKKQTGALGVFLSAMNVYKLTPPMNRKTA